MSSSEWFDDVQVIGALSPAQAAEKLRQVGENDLADQLEPRDENGRPIIYRGTGWWPFEDKPWQHTAHAFGYLAPTAPGSEPMPLVHAGNIAPDKTLKHARVRVTLDALRVAKYPGGGVHHILFDFFARNQPEGAVENLHFTATYRALDGERAALLGYPIFVGLNVGSEGVDFKCFTVNVQNDDDEQLLAILESDTFKAGLRLAEVAQPVVGLFSDLALGITKAIAKRNRNVPVQDFYLGLDFTNVAMRARLAEGSYIAVQVPESAQTVWDWSEWVYDPNTGQIVNRTAPGQLIPYNYIVFGVSRFEE